MATTRHVSVHSGWDLSSIFTGDAAAIDSLERVRLAADELTRRTSGRLASMPAPDFADLIGELDSIFSQTRALESFSRLRGAVDTSDTTARDLAAAVQPGIAILDSVLDAFDSEIAALVPARREMLRSEPVLVAHLPWLNRLWEASQPPPDVAGVALRAPAISAWQALYRRTLAAVRVPAVSGTGSESVGDLVAAGRDPNAEVRRTARQALEAALEPIVPTLAAAHDALVVDRWMMAKLRGFDHPITEVNGANELSDEAVEHLLGFSESNYELMRRWYRLKAKLLEVPVLSAADVIAPVGRLRNFDVDAAIQVVIGALDPIWPAAVRAVVDVVEERRIDASPRPHKEMGNFCAPVAPHHKPMIFLNHRDTTTDVLTLAHECGHAIHDVLAAGQPPRLCDPRPILAEAAALLVERLVLDAMLSAERDPAVRTGLLGILMQGDVAAIFYHTLLTRFELAMFEIRRPDSRASQVLDEPVLCALWNQLSNAAYGDALDSKASRGLEWCWIPHFVTGPFRTYPYLMSQMVAIAWHERVIAEPAAFIPRLETLLSAGSSAAPGPLLAGVGIDVKRTDWIESAMEHMAHNLTRIEAAAASG